MAHDIKSPGVSVQVIDQTAFAAVTQGTVAATVGFAEKGPINEPVLVLSKDDFLSNFGYPIADNYYMGLFADRFLDVSTGYFTRIGKEVDYEGVTGTVGPGLNFSAVPNPEFWVELSGFPIPNDGIYKVAWTGGGTYANIAALASAINTAMNGVTVADGSTKLGSLLQAAADSTGTYLVIRANIYRNVVITMKASSSGTNNVVKTSGAGNLGMVDGASSSDVGSYAYAYVRVPVNPVAATNASITGTTAMTVSDLNKLSAYNKINLNVDGSDGAPFKSYTDLDITPATGSPAGFPGLTGANDPALAVTWAGTTISITLSGFYHFMSGDGTSQVNATFAPAVSYAGGAGLAALVVALNNALNAITITGSNTLLHYIQFSTSGTKLTIVEGTGARKNYGSDCSILIADGTGTIANLGYSSPTNNSATGADATYTAAGVAAKISAQAPEVLATSSTSIVSIASQRTGSTSFVKILTASTAASDALGILHFTTATSATGSNASSTQGVVNFVAKDAGEYGNRVKVRTYKTTNPVTSADQYFIEVFYKTDSVEVWGPVSWTDDAASNFVKTLLANSNYIMVDFGETVQYPNSDTGILPLAAPPNNADPGNPEYWQLAGGNNGIPSSSNEADALAVAALEEYNNKEQYEIDVVLAPGFVSAAVANKLQSMGEARGDVVVLVDPPAFLSYTDAINWHNGSYSGSVALSSSYTIATWDWQKDYDDSNAQYVDLPPSIYMAVALARTQKNYELWEAPAGPERGIVNSISSYSKPTQAQREYLYNDTDPACINPIVQFPTEGIMIYGQKTCLRQTKSLNRINVRRLINFIKRNVEKIARKYIFQLNEASTWAAVSRELNSFLGNILERGGLQAFTVVFDNTTTTADKIDAGIMYGKIFVQPTRVAERIFIDITIQRTGALVGEG